MAKQKMLKANNLDAAGDEPHVQLAALIPKTLHTKLKVKAIKEGRYLNRVIREALHAAVARD